MHCCTCHAPLTINEQIEYETADEDSISLPVCDDCRDYLALNPLSLAGIVNSDFDPQPV